MLEWSMGVADYKYSLVGHSAVNSVTPVGGVLRLSFSARHCTIFHALLVNHCLANLLLVKEYADSIRESKAKNYADYSKFSSNYSAFHNFFRFHLNSPFRVCKN